MDEEKEELLAKLVPKAVLKAVTNKAKHTIIKRTNGLDILLILDFPFRIGREARVCYSENGPIIQERHNIDQKPNNDVYLLDNNNLLEISREHCSIVKQNDKYILVDRGSACGSMVNRYKIGNGSAPNCPLEDGDIITLGSEDSEYKFKFICLQKELNR